MIRNLFLGLAFAATIIIIPTSGQAAILNIDDSDPANITIEWSGFNEFFIDGVDQGTDGTVILADAGYSLDGSNWNDTTTDEGALGFVYFALPSDTTGVTSGVITNAVYSGGIGTLIDDVVNAVFNSGFAGFTGSTYFSTSESTVAQDGHTEAYSVAGLPGLGVTFTSEAASAAVPEPASLTLVGMGALGLIAGAYRRRRQAA